MHATDTDTELLQIAQCCEDMLCSECGTELDSGEDCDCPCHNMV